MPNKFRNSSDVRRWRPRRLHGASERSRANPYGYEDTLRMVFISLMLATFAAERRWTWIGCTIEQRGHIDEASSPGLSARGLVAGVHRVVVLRLYLTILLQNYLKRCARLNVTYLRTLSVNNHQHVETSVVLFGIEARENPARGPRADPQSLASSESWTMGPRLGDTFLDRRSDRQEKAGRTRPSIRPPRGIGLGRNDAW